MIRREERLLFGRKFEVARRTFRSRCLLTMKHLIAFTLLVFAVGADEVVCAEVIAPASERFASRDSLAVPDFQRHVVPLLGRLGCNSAKCHGSFQGQGDFRLSLFGFDFQSDYAASGIHSH